MTADALPDKYKKFTAMHTQMDPKKKHDMT